MFWLIPLGLGFLFAGAAGCAAESEVEFDPPPPTPCGDGCRRPRENQDVRWLLQLKKLRYFYLPRTFFDS